MRDACAQPPPPGRVADRKPGPFRPSKPAWHLKRREDWFDNQLDLDPENLVFIDETWATITPAQRPQRCVKRLQHSGHLARADTSMPSGRRCARRCPSARRISEFGKLEVWLRAPFANTHVRFQHNLRAAGGPHAPIATMGMAIGRKNPWKNPNSIPKSQSRRTLDEAAPHRRQGRVASRRASALALASS